MGGVPARRRKDVVLVVGNKDYKCNKGGTGGNNSDEQVVGSEGQGVG